MALEALKLTSQRLEKIYTPEYVMQQALAMQAKAQSEGLSLDEAKTFEEINQRTGRALESIKQLIDHRQKIPDSVVVLRLENELRDAAPADREKIKRNIAFAKSDSRVLKELAKTLLTTIEDLNAPLPEDP
jgi:hypothetical protein